LSVQNEQEHLPESLKNRWPVGAFGSALSSTVGKIGSTPSLHSSSHSSVVEAYGRFNGLAFVFKLCTHSGFCTSHRSVEPDIPQSNSRTRPQSSISSLLVIQRSAQLQQEHKFTRISAMLTQPTAFAHPLDLYPPLPLHLWMSPLYTRYLIEDRGYHGFCGCGRLRRPASFFLRL